VLSTRPLKSGTYEVRMANNSGWIYSVGLATKDHDIDIGLGMDGESWGYQYTGNVLPGPRYYGAGFSQNTVGVVVDVRAGTVSFSVDGTLQGGGVAAFSGLPQKPLFLATSFGWQGTATIIPPSKQLAESLRL